MTLDNIGLVAEMKVGVFEVGIFKPLPVETYLAPMAMSVPHEVYELRAETTPMTAYDEARVVDALLRVDVPGMEILGVEAKGNKIKMQVTGSPFAWAPLLIAIEIIIIPLIVLIIGIILAYRIPGWALAVPFVAGGVALVVYAYYKGKVA